MKFSCKEVNEERNIGKPLSLILIYNVSMVLKIRNDFIWYRQINIKMNVKHEFFCNVVSWIYMDINM